MRTSLRVTFAVGNARPADGSYGTFAIESATRPQPYVVRRNYPGSETPAQVAYQTLRAALEYILAVLARTGRQPADFALEIAGDVPLVIGQRTGSGVLRPPELQPLNDHCLALLRQFGSYHLTVQTPSAPAPLQDG